MTYRRGLPYIHGSEKNVDGEERFRGMFEYLLKPIANQEDAQYFYDNLPSWAKSAGAAALSNKGITVITTGLVGLIGFNALDGELLGFQFNDVGDKQA